MRMCFVLVLCAACGNSKPSADPTSTRLETTPPTDACAAIRTPNETDGHGNRSEGVNAVTIRGPRSKFPLLTRVKGLDATHGMAGDDGADHILAAYATNEAVTEIRGLGFTVRVDATEEQQNEALARALREDRGCAPSVPATPSTKK